MANWPTTAHVLARSEKHDMTYTFIKCYYGIALFECVIIVGKMAVVEYRGLILPPALMCFVLIALAGILLGDWLVQICIKRHMIE